MHQESDISPEEKLSQQRTRNAYGNLHILHSKYYKFYKSSSSSEQTNTTTSFLENNILDYKLASLSHNKRKKANEKLICMEFLRDSKTVILGYDKSSERGDINTIDVSEPKINEFYYNRLQGGIGGLACFKDGRFVLAADKKGNFTVIDMFRGPDIEDIKNKTMETPYEGVLSMSLSPSESKLVVGMNDRKCRVIDIESQKAQKIFPLCKTFDKHAYGINSVEWHPYKSLVISSSLDSNDTLKLWDPHSEELIHESNFHKNSIITKCKFHPDGNSYFSLGKDNTILEYEMRYKGILNKFYMQSEPTSMAVTNNGEIVAGDTTGYLVWFSRHGQVLKSEKGSSAVVHLRIEDSGTIMVVAREREHTFEIITKESLFDLNEY